MHELFSQLALAIYRHCLVNRHPIPDTPCSRLETMEMLPCLQASADLCDDWLFIA